MKIWREYSFEAAHSLPRLPEGHKCKKVHGHNYRVRVTLEGAVKLDEHAMVINYAFVDSVWFQVIYPYVDHHDLNEVLQMPTAEALAIWIWGRFDLTVIGDRLVTVEVMENERSGAVLQRGDAEVPVRGKESPPAKISLPISPDDVSGGNP